MGIPGIPSGNSRNSRPDLRTWEFQVTSFVIRFVRSGLAGMSLFVWLFVLLPALWPMKWNETFRRDSETESRPWMYVHVVFRNFALCLKPAKFR